MIPAPRARLQEIEEAWLNLLAAEVNAYGGLPSFVVRFSTEREAVSEAIAAALITAACLAAEGEEEPQGNLRRFLQSREFYELMQTYRHMPPTYPQETVDVYEAIKAAVLNPPVASPASPEGEEEPPA